MNIEQHSRTYSKVLRLKAEYCGKLNESKLGKYPLFIGSRGTVQCKIYIRVSDFFIVFLIIKHER